MPVVERALTRLPTIAGEQEVMVRRLTLQGDGVALVPGRPETARRSHWPPPARREASGRVVIGAAIARRAAGQLSTGSVRTARPAHSGAPARDAACSRRDR